MTKAQDTATDEELALARFAVQDPRVIIEDDATREVDCDGVRVAAWVFIPNALLPDEE